MTFMKTGMGVALCIIQLAVPASMILGRETILREGVSFKFKTAPVDPYDAFRGRYVALRLEPDSLPTPAHSPWRVGQWVNIVVGQNESGFAVIQSVETEPPPTPSYIHVKIRQITPDLIHFELPFDRYYMEEKLAPAAEAAYRRNSGREKRDAHLVVRIRSGRAVIEDLFICEKPILEYVKEQQTLE